MTGIAVAGEGEAAPAYGALLARLRRMAALDRQSWALWTPVALGIGCAVYIGLQREPGWLLAAAPALIALTCAVAARLWGQSRALTMIATLAFCAALGLLAAKARTESVRTPVAGFDGPVQITGWVVDVTSPGATGGRLIIAPISMGDLAPDQLPARIRMTVRGGLIGPGAAVRFRGLVNPPPAPASPGAYDFARNAWFDRIGGVGVALTDLVVINPAPPAERAAITGAVAFGAVLADRRAISLHALAVAAFVVLLMQPEAVAEPGFQMSFAATAALVALAELWQRPPREINTPWPIRLVQGAGLWLGVSLAASFVAGLATGPFAIQHFNRVALYGLPANLLTEPLSTFVIMPFLALGAVFETVGLGGPFLWVAGWGIDLMNGMAVWVQGQPHATLLVASAPAIALPVAFLGILWLCLWKGPLRWLGLPLALAVSLWPRPEPPVAWIASDGMAAAVRSGGSAVFMRPTAKLFAAELWSHRRGLQLPEEGAQAGVFDCDSQSCAAVYDGALRVSAWWTVRKPKPERLAQLCQADILVIKADVDLTGCRARTLTPPDFAKGGAVEIYEDGRMVWAQPLRGDRPWTQLSDSGE